MVIVQSCTVLDVFQELCNKAKRIFLMSQMKLLYSKQEK